MGYSVKWVNEHLGITRDMLRYYEKERLIPSNQNRKYRNYSETDIERIWAIKLLIDIKFTAKEIFALMNDPTFDFDTAIKKKINKLEQDLDTATSNLEFAKAICFTGCIPTTPNLGSIRFEEFILEARKHFKLDFSPTVANAINVAEKLTGKGTNNWNLEDLKDLAAAVAPLSIDARLEGIYQGYCDALSSMKDLEYSNTAVQRVVKLLYECAEDLLILSPDGVSIPPNFSKHLAHRFLAGSSASSFEQRYGKDGCLFIAQAIAHYGGLTLDDL